MDFSSLTLKPAEAEARHLEDRLVARLVSAVTKRYTLLHSISLLKETGDDLTFERSDKGSLFRR